jgi:hypothetical protein
MKQFKFEVIYYIDYQRLYKLSVLYRGKSKIVNLISYNHE